MGTEILRPQNCLIPSLCNPNTNSHNPKSFKKKRSRLPRQARGIAIGQVTILKRGESLISDPEPKQIRIVEDRVADGYAGSAISMSPSPRSVPLPNFWSREESATKDLRRLLRLH